MSMGLFSLALRVINISGGFGNVKNALVFNIGKLRFPWGSQGPKSAGENDQPTLDYFINL